MFGPFSRLKTTCHPVPADARCVGERYIPVVEVMMPRAVVFDLDGTLSDSRDAIVATAAAAFEQHGLAAPNAAAVQALIGLPLAEVITRLLPPGVSADREPPITAAYIRSYVPLAHAHERLFAGALALLDRLANNGHVLAIATGKSQHGAEAATRRLGIYERFASVRGVSSVPRGKPHPDLLNAVLEDLAVRPENAILIGDTSYDLHMAAAAGVDCCAVTWGVHPEETLRACSPKFMARSMQEILTAVQ